MKDWKESWIDWMGLIVALSGEKRFYELETFKLRMNELLIPPMAPMGALRP